MGIYSPYQEMNTKILMTASSLALGATGLGLTFAPGEIATHIDAGTTPLIIFQLLGALYFGFAMLNWTAKDNLTGGIYSRPVTIGNFTHFLIGGLALLKLVTRNFEINTLSIAAFVYLVFAILFGYVLFTSPFSVSQKNK